MNNLRKYFTTLAFILGMLLIPIASRAACPTSSTYGFQRNATLASLGITQCFYIAANGSDSNDGLSSSTPWLHAPGMSTCINNCLKQVNGTSPYPGMIGGVGFIFRGGDTWHFGNSSASPYTGGFWSIWGIWGYHAGTDRDNCYDDQHTTGCTYFGVDPTWYKSGDPAWSRPILTADNSPSISYVNSCAYQIDMHGEPYIVNLMVQTGVATMFDNFELTGICAQQPKFNPVTAPQDAFVSMGGAEVQGISMDFVSNLYIHGWSVAKIVYPSIVALQRSSGVVTVTTGVAHGWQAGDTVIIEKITGWTTDPNSNDGLHGLSNPGVWTITAVDTVNHLWFQFNQAGANETISSGGLTNAYANSNQIPLYGFNGGVSGMHTMDYNIVDGFDSPPGTLIWAWAPSYYHLRYNYMTNAVGAVGQQCHDIHDNILDNQQNPAAPTHGNILECNSNYNADGVQHPKNTPNVFYNNIIRHASTEMADAGNVKLWLAPPNPPEYWFNNILYDIGPGNFWDLATAYYSGDFLIYYNLNSGLQKVSGIELTSNVLKVWTKGKYEAATATITGIAITSNVVLVTASNTFTNQNWVEFRGLTTNTFLNGKQLRVQLPDWQASHAYLIGDIVLIGSNYHQVQTAGTSGSGSPTWASVGNTTSDGGVVWLNLGTSAPSFKVNFTHANVTQVSDTGTARYVHPFPNTYHTGMAVKLEGLTTNTFLNGQTVVITAVDTSNPNSGDEFGEWFTAAYTHANVSYVDDAGFARHGGIKMFNNTLVQGSTGAVGQPCYAFIYDFINPPDMNLTVYNEHLISTPWSESLSNTFPCTGHGDTSNIEQSSTQAHTDGYTTDTNRLNFSVPSLNYLNCANESTGPCRTSSSSAATIGMGRNLSAYCTELAQYATSGTINGEFHDAEYGIGVTAADACLHEFPNRTQYNTTTRSIVVGSTGRLRGSTWDSGAYQFLSVITSFTRSGDINVSGGSATLTWTTSGASSCTLDNGYGAVSLNSSASAIPARTTVYTLTCDGQQARVTVFVGGALKY
jgi:hypothetical protein